MTPVKLQRRIGRRLIIFVILFSSAITLVTTGLQLYREFEMNVGSLRDSVHQLEASSIPSIKEALWALDLIQLQILLDGIVKLPDVTYVEVRDQGKILVSSAGHSEAPSILERYDLVFDRLGAGKAIGELVVHVSFDGIFLRLLDRIEIILLSNGLKTFLVALFISFLFGRMVTRHLSRMASHVREIDPLNKVSPLKLDRPTRQAEQSDELEDLTSAINEMEANTFDSHLQLQLSEGRLRAVMDGVADAIITIDENGLIDSFNHAAGEMFGYGAEEIYGKNFSILMSETDRSEHDRYLENYRETGLGNIIGIGPRELTAKRKDGTVFPIDLSIAEARPGDHRIFVGVIRDITDRKYEQAILQQAQKMEAFGQLTSGVAHDFNNILAVISGNIELIADHLDDPALDRMAQNALNASNRGAQLTQRLLSFSRKQMLAPKPIELNAFVSDMIDLMRRTLGETIEIDVIESDTFWKCEADPGQLANAILNLALNARDAMPGGGRLTIETAN